MAADFLKRSREPAPVEPGTGAAARPPGFFERRRRRARLREQLAVREEMLLELGALVFELHRQGQRAPELLQARAAELDAVDAEVRAMEESLQGGDPAAWPAEQAPDWTDGGEWDGEAAGTGDWDADAHQTGEWDAEQTGEWDAIADPTGEWDAAADPTGEWGAIADQTGEWNAPEADETGEWDAAGQPGEWQETGEWAEPDGEDPGETQEWSVTEALEAEDVSADPHDPAAEDVVEDPPAEGRP